jgi:hypothetical protein
MIEHISTSRMIRFCVRALPVGELTVIAEHLGGCPACHQQFTDTLRSRRGSAPLEFTLAPEFWFRHEHVDYEQLIGLADRTLDGTELKIIDVHLKVCATCAEDVRSFLEFREQIAPEIESVDAPVLRDRTQRSLWLTWWRALAWKPIYAATVVLIGLALVIGAAFFLKRRTNNFQAKRTPTPNINLGAPAQITPNNRAANNQSPPATPNESPVENPNSSAAIIALNDRVGMVTVDKSGKLSGLDDVPAPTRDEIAQVLLSERVERPTILKDLAGQNSSLRGSNGGQSFKLIFPTRTVVVSNRPAFKWEKILGASSYRVYVNDTGGHEVARSEDLSPEHTGWALPKPLKRGAVYAWSVVALVNDQEIVSPGPGAPEMKFQVLSAISLRQLNQMKKTRSHLALGLFYTKAGMLSNAEHEFKQLSLLNSRSKLATNLVRSIRLMRTQGQ